MTSLDIKGYRLIVRPEDPEETYGDSKIVLVQDQRQARAAVNFGEVLSVGKHAWKGYKGGAEEAWCEVGDRICWAQYSGYDVEDPVTGEKLRVLNDEDVVAVIKEN